MTDKNNNENINKEEELKKKKKKDQDMQVFIEDSTLSAFGLSNDMIETKFNLKNLK